MDTISIKKQIKDSIDLKNQLFQDDILVGKIENVINIVVTAFKEDKKVLFCGNGGSAADAQHLAAEFSGRYYHDRDPLYSEALHVNTSYITAVANDYSFDKIYSRLIKAMGNEGDVLIALSTSGNSQNVIEAAKEAICKKMHVISFTGLGGGKLKNISDIMIEIPSKDTPRIQECHMLIGHIICQQVEEILFK